MFNTQMSVGEVARLFNVIPRTLQSWVPYMIESNADAVGGGGIKGRHRAFGFSALMQIAVALEAMKLGVTAARAFEIGATFAYASSQRDLFTGDRRIPSCPFPYEGGDTFLLVRDGAVSVYQDTGRVSTRKLFSGAGGFSGALVLNATKAFDKVCTDLGYDPAPILAERYAAHRARMAAAEG